MKKVVTLVALVMLLNVSSKAQAKTDAPVEQNSFKINNQFDLSLGAAKNEFIESLSYRHIWGLGKHKQWRVGGGVRFSSYQGSNGNYLSASPKFSGKSELTDTLSLLTAQQNNLAILVAASYRIKNKFELGFNIDLVGYSFGATQNATFISNKIATPTSASANAPTALLVGPNDLGMIRAEFTLGYWVSDKTLLRIGLTSLNTEYKTATELQTDNSRFRRNSQLPFIAVTYSPKHN